MTNPTSPRYVVRQSKRARRVSLIVTTDGVVEVVIPRGFDRALIPGILHEKRRWIEQATRRMSDRQHFLKAQPTLPSEISLQAIGEMWQVAYCPTTSSRVTVTERPGRRLRLSGRVDDVVLCQTALRKWLARKAKGHLVPWLRAISEAERLPFARASVRGQKTRWGSCSPRGTISINYKLLFLPGSLVRYVLIHELCHTRHMNHSPQFWTMVKEREPGCKRLRAALRKAWRYVPGWLEN